MMSNDVTFDETCMRMKYKDLYVFEDEFPTSKTRYGNEDSIPPASSIVRQPTVAHDYQLARDGENGKIIAPKWYGYKDLVCYDLSVVENMQVGIEYL